MGGVLHQAWFVDDQLNVVDIWQSAEDLSTFLETRLMPGVTQALVTGQPEVEILPIYHFQVEKPFVPGAVVAEEEIPVGAYQALEAAVKWRELPPIGGISHIACIDGDMMRSISVFESEGDIELFEAERIGPAAAALGFPAPPPDAKARQLHAGWHPPGAPSRS